MPHDNTAPQTIAVSATTFDNAVAASKAVSSVTFDNAVAASKSVSSTTFDNAAPLVRVVTAQTFLQTVGANLYADPFSGANGTPLAAPWELGFDGVTLPTYQGGQAVSAGGVPSSAVHDSISQADAYVSIKTMGVEPAEEYRLIGRQLSADYTYWVGMGGVFNAGSVVLLRRSDGEDTIIAGPVTVTYVAGAVLKLSIEGAHLRVYYNGAEVISFVDSSPFAITDPGKWGFGFNLSPSEADDFVIGTLAVGGPDTKTVSAVTFDNAVAASKAVTSTAFDNTAPQTITPVF